MAPDDARPLPAGSGSPRSLRRANVRRVVEALSAGPATQSALALATGLSPATISNLVRELRHENRVETTATTSNGRRATLVTLRDARPAPSLGLDVGRRHVRALVATAEGEVLAQSLHDLPLDADRATCLAVARTATDEALAAAGTTRDQVGGAGVAVVAPLDRRTGTIGHAALWPALGGVPVAEVFEQALDLRVVVENDANAGALAESRWGGHDAQGALVYVKVATGIGAGIVLDGRLHRGHIGVAGEIGHLPAGAYATVCRCGNRGCVETVASVPAMLSALGERDGRPVRTGEVLDLVAGGDVAALRVLEDAALALGRVLGGVCNILDPQVVVVGGPLHRAGEAFLDPLRHGIRRASNPAVGGSTQVVLTRLGDQVEALGAAVLGAQHREDQRKRR